VRKKFVKRLIELFNVASLVFLAPLELQFEEVNNRLEYAY